MRHIAAIFLLCVRLHSSVENSEVTTQTSINIPGFSLFANESSDVIEEDHLDLDIDNNIAEDNETRCQSVFADIVRRKDELKISPIDFKSTVTNVTMGGSILGVHSVIERENRVIVLLSFHIMWRDQRIHWTTDQCMHRMMTMYPASTIWFPYIYIINGFETNIDPFLWHENVAFLFFDGTIQLVIAKKFDILCDIKVAAFPFDHQTCSVKLFVFTWAHIIVPQVNLTGKLLLLHNEVWKVESAWIVVEEAPASMPEVRFTFKISRDARFYYLTLIAPTMVLSPLPILIFLLPPDSGEKMTVSLTILLTYFVMALTLFESLPMTNQIPIIGWLFIYQMIITAGGGFLAVLVLRMAANENLNPSGIDADATVLCLDTFCNGDVPGRRGRSQTLFEFAVSEFSPTDMYLSTRRPLVMAISPNNASPGWNGTAAADEHRPQKFAQRRRRNRRFSQITSKRLNKFLLLLYTCLSGVAPACAILYMSLQ